MNPEWVVNRCYVTWFYHFNFYIFLSISFNFYIKGQMRTQGVCLHTEYKSAHRCQRPRRVPAASLCSTCLCPVWKSEDLAKRLGHLSIPANLLDEPKSMWHASYGMSQDPKSSLKFSDFKKLVFSCSYPAFESIYDMSGTKLRLNITIT